MRWMDTDDVDRSGRDYQVDRRVAAVDGQRLMGFHEDQAFDRVGDILLDAGACRRDLVEMFIAGPAILRT